ncbi:hypothetical protein ACES2D_12620 [Bacillus amyloliquefaciens]|uniref:hypothetical protein n=1 Tax=Bacillus amyloliquefaciens TaxID=1390 RepID=UPI0035BFDDB3
MAKLNGVKTLDMVNGEITKVAYGGVEYERVEGRSAIYDSLFEVYACGSSCWSEWYAENETDYKRRWAEAVDL